MRMLARTLENSDELSFNTQMAAPFGNQNAKGNKGGRPGRSGRRSHYQERADAEFLWRMFIEPVDKDEIDRRIRSGKYSAHDVMTLKALCGSERLMVAVFNKLFPNNMTMAANVNQKQMKTLEENIRSILKL